MITFGDGRDVWVLPMSTFGHIKGSARVMASWDLDQEVKRRGRRPLWAEVKLYACRTEDAGMQTYDLLEQKLVCLQSGP
jgi:hypothetical protein